MKVKLVCENEKMEEKPVRKERGDLPYEEDRAKEVRKGG
jgi:hypothetical protein